MDNSKQNLIPFYSLNSINISLICLKQSGNLV